MNSPLGPNFFWVNPRAGMPVQPYPIFPGAPVQPYYALPNPLAQLPSPTMHAAATNRFASATPVSVLPSAEIGRLRSFEHTAPEQQACTGEPASNNPTPQSQATDPVPPTTSPDAESCSAQLTDRINAQLEELSRLTRSLGAINGSLAAQSNATNASTSMCQQELKRLFDQTQQEFCSLVADGKKNLGTFKESTLAPIKEAQLTLKHTITEERQKLNLTYQRLDEINQRLVPLALSYTTLSQNLVQKLDTLKHTLAEELHSHLIHLLERSLFRATCIT